MSLGIPRADPQGQLAPVHCSLLRSLLPAYAVKDKLKEKGWKKINPAMIPDQYWLCFLSRAKTESKRCRNSSYSQKVKLWQDSGTGKEKLPSLSSLPSCVWELLVKERVAHSTTASNFLGSNLTLKGLTGRVRAHRKAFSCAPFPFPATCDTNTWFS